MMNFGTAIGNFWVSFTSVLNSFRFPVDLIDIIVVAYILYHGIRLVRETRAMQLLKGILAILLVYFVAFQLNMIVLGFFITNILQVGIYILVVLFQPELRSALEQMGRSKLGIGRLSNTQLDEPEIRKTEQLIDILSDSCRYLAARKTGALLVIERQTKLGDVIKTGTRIDAQPSVELISNLFFINSPLHDGATVIRDGRLYAAGCYLPLSQNMEIGRELGTRHRAALGMSEVSDAVVIVVSEETGAVSVAADSRLQRKLSEQNLKKLLHIKLLGAATKEETAEKKRGFWRAGKWGK